MADTRPATARRPWSWAQAAMFGLPLVAFVVAAWAHRNILDDGFIYLRVVHSVTSGHGPVFNVGQRVEAFTSPLWLGVLSIADLLAPFRLEWIAVVIGIAATLGGLVLSIAGSARLVRQHEPDALLVPFGVLLVAALTPMWLYATSGLETGLAFLWIGLSLWLLATWSRSSRKMPLLGGAVLGVGWLVRPELVLYSILFLALVLGAQWRVDSWRDRTKLVAAAVALPVIYQVFRMGYYANVVANTAITKEGTRFNWGRGWTYFTDFFSTYWFVIPVLVVLAGGYVPLARGLRRIAHRRSVGVLGAFLAGAVLNALYIIAVGGDYEHARLLLPAVFALCAPIAAVAFTRHYVVALAAAPWVVAAVFVMRPPSFVLGSTYLTPPVGRVTTDDQGWGGGSANLALFTDDGLYLQMPPRLVFYRGDVPISPSVTQPEAAVFAIGIMPYAVGDRLSVLDLYGLADAITARLEIPTNASLRPYPGQEKPLPEPWIAARVAAPGAQVDESTFDTPNYSLIRRTKGAAFDRQVAAARAALQCAPIKQLDDDTEAPLTVSRFFGNIVDSFSNTRLRIPPDPQAAVDKLCGKSATAAVAHLLRGFGQAPTLFVSTTAPDHRAAAMTAPDLSAVMPADETTSSARPLVALAGFV